MSKVEQLTCPACGAHDVSQISGVNYQCNYCNSVFIVKDDNPFSGFNKNKTSFSGLSKEEILEKLKKGEIPFSSESTTTFHTTVDVNVQRKPVAKPARSAGIVAVVVILILVGAGAAVFTLKSKSGSKNNGSLDGWKTPNIYNYNCLVGSKGAVVWLLLKARANTSDSVKYWLRLIDPTTKKIIAEGPLGQSTAWQEPFHLSKQFDSEFYVVNDTAYNISEDGGMQAFDLYSGKKLLGNEWFETKFPELKDGIAKLDKQYYKKRVKLTTASGDKFYYYPDTKLLIDKKAGDKSDPDKPVFSEDIYLSRTQKSQLYLCNMKRGKDDDFYVSENYVEQFKSHSPNLYSNIKSIRSIGDVVYAKALPLQENDHQLLFFYATGFSKNAGGVLALVNKEGVFSWKNTDTTFKKVINGNRGDNIYLDYHLNKNFMVINLNNNGYQSIGVDLKTGKTQFVFQQSDLNN